MVSVGVRRLKANLSRYLRHAQAGAQIQVTERGRPIAAIVPLTPASDLTWAHQVVAEGRARWNGSKPGGTRGMAKGVGPKRGAPKASDIVIADRR